MSTPISPIPITQPNQSITAMSVPRLNLHTPAQIIKQSTISFVSNFSTFFFLSLILLSFRITVESGTLIVTTFIDRDPSLKSLLSRLDLADKSVRDAENLRYSPARRHRPFLHLTRVGTLDDDFFSTDEDEDRNLFKFGATSFVNDSLVHKRKLGFSDEDGIRFYEVVGSKFHFEDVDFERNETAIVDKEEEEEEEEEEGEEGEEERVIGGGASDLQSFFKGFELARRDATALFYLVSIFSTAYCWMILAYLVMHSCVLGVVFLAVVNSLLAKYNSFIGMVSDGSQLGFRRLSGVLLIRWAVRDALTQLLGFWYFGEIEDQYSFLKLFVRLKLMPFSVALPWIRGFDKEIPGFLFAWVMLDALVAFVFALDCWVAIVDTRMSSKEIVKEGCYLISMMLSQAVPLKCSEAILSGSVVRFVLSRMFGKFFAMFVQSLLEVYFMVVWLIFYFAVRCKDAELGGRRFGQRDLENYVNHLR